MPEEKKKAPGPLLKNAASVIITLIAGFAAGYFIAGDMAVQRLSERQQARKEIRNPMETGYMVDFRDIIISVNGRYCKLSFTLEIKDSAIPRNMEKLRPVMLDSLISAAGNFTPGELQRETGREEFRSLLISGFREILGAKTINIYFSSFIVQ